MNNIYSSPSEKNIPNNIEYDIKFIGIARVIKTILGDNEEDEDYKKYGKSGAIGAIKYELVYQKKPWETLRRAYQKITGRPELLPIALPFNSTILNYPIHNEIVMLFTGPSLELNQGRTYKSVFYLGPYSLWNNVNQNAFPDLHRLSGMVNDKNVSIKTNQLGISDNNEIKTQDNFNPTEMYGPDFIEQAIPQPVIFNGDVVFTGRFGQRIRFGHTVTLKKFLNNWSDPIPTTSDKDPITIITNRIASNEDKFKPTSEDINKDESVIYLTSTQKIPLDLSEYKLLSFGDNDTNTITLISTK